MAVDIKMKSLLFVGIVAVTIAVGTSLKCYGCQNCGDPFKKDVSKEFNCTGISQACEKTVFKFSNGTESIRRSCATGIARVSKDPVYIASAMMETCTKDLCNGAPSVDSTSLLLSFVSIIFAMFVIGRN